MSLNTRVMYMALKGFQIVTIFEKSDRATTSKLFQCKYSELYDNDKPKCLKLLELFKVDLLL